MAKQMTRAEERLQVKESNQRDKRLSMFQIDEFGDIFTSYLEDNLFNTNSRKQEHKLLEIAEKAILAVLDYDEKKFKTKELTMTEQKDPNGIGAHDGGSKLDFGKNRVSLLFMQYFPNAIDAVTSVSEFGAKKYSPGGWKDVPDGMQRYTDALSRHYLADCKGEVFDKETKLPHDFQLAWNALARIEFGLKEGKYDMKPSKFSTWVESLPARQGEKFKEVFGFDEVLATAAKGKEIPNDRKPAKSVSVKLETTCQPPEQNEFNPNAAGYIDVNGVLWMPVKEKNKKNFGYDIEKVVARHERMLKPHNAQDQNSRERDALEVPTENPDLEKAEAKSNIVPATPSVTGVITYVNETCPQCGSREGYRAMAGNWMCEQCQSKRASATPPLSAYEQNISASCSNISPVNALRDQLNDDYDQAQITKLP